MRISRQQSDRAPEGQKREGDPPPIQTTGGESNGLDWYAD
jgi:hypothetical protein